MRSLFALAALSGTVLGAGGPENVVVVVNGDSWASMCVANEYGALRDIAPEHFVVVHDLPSFEQMKVADFREKILQPVLAAVERRGLGAQIDYLLYSTDFPTAIDVSADMAGKTFPRQITQPAAITGLTYLYQFTLAKNPGYLGLNTNFYFRQIAQVAPAKPMPPADQQRYDGALKKLQEIATRMEQSNATKPSKEDEGQLREVRDTFLALKAVDPERTELLYNLACAQARLEEGEAAIATLRAAMEHGWWDMRHAQQDPDFRQLRDRAEFKELVARAREAKFELWPTSGFRGNVGWLPSGRPVPPKQGMRYLLSTMLGYTSGRGNSVEEVIEGLRRSVKADGSRPNGTVYLMENDDVRSDVREWAFRRVSDKLREVGVQARVENGVLPTNKSDVAGLTVGASDFDWRKSGSSILAGAICDHLTSFGGMLHEGDAQMPLTEFMRHGAAGASGTVREPYAIQAKFPTGFLHYHYAQGCTLGEAFYQSVAGPYQLLIMGDALCAPWKKRMAVSMPELRAGMTLRGRVKFAPTSTSADELQVSHYDLHLDGRKVAIVKPGDPAEIDSATAPDGQHEFQIVANGTDALGTTARLVVPCSIANRAEELRIEPVVKGEHTWDESLELNITAPNATRVALRHMGREVRNMEGAQGKVRLDLRMLGQGPVRVQPIAYFEGGREVWGEALRFRVVAPAALPALELPREKVLVGGMHVIPVGGTAAVAAKAEGEWLSKAGVAANGEFVVEGWFQVDADGSYQFQLHGPATLRLIIDGEQQDWPRGKEWWFVPVALKKGLHRMRVEATAQGAPQLDVRFGGPGSYRLDGARFQHLEPSP